MIWIRKSINRQNLHAWWIVESLSIWQETPSGIPESDCFPSEEAAKAECVRRNRVLGVPE